MKLKATPSVKGSVVETVISIDSFGAEGLPAEEEKELFEDFKIVVNYGKLDFSRYVKVDEHKNPVIVEVNKEEQQDGDEPVQVEADLITLGMPINESYEIDADTELKYSVDVNALGDSSKYLEYIPDNICLAKAMCLVFEDVIIKYIQTQFEISKQHKDDFENTRFYVI